MSQSAIWPRCVQVQSLNPESNSSDKLQVHLISRHIWSGDHESGIRTELHLSQHWFGSGKVVLEREIGRNVKENVYKIRHNMLKCETTFINSVPLTHMRKVLIDQQSNSALPLHRTADPGFSR